MNRLFEDLQRFREDEARDERITWQMELCWWGAAACCALMVILG